MSEVATIDDVAKAAGVSKSTVSNVFSKKRPISKEVTEHVLKVAKELNYRPNYWAQSLANKQGRIIGLNMQAEKIKFSQFHLSLLNGVIHECYKHGYMILVNPLPSEQERMKDSPVDGEIILDPMENDIRLKKISSQTKPCVVIGKPPASSTAFPYVDNDNVELMKKAVNHLLELEHTHFLFLNAPKNRTVAQDRQAGFEQAMMAAGLPLDHLYTIHMPEAETSIDFAYHTTKKMLMENEKITAIVTDTDKMALGVYRAAQELHKRIPEDLSILAFSDGSVFTSELVPALTHVKLNAESLGQAATHLLLQQLESHFNMINRVIVSAELIIQHSTGISCSS